MQRAGNKIIAFACQTRLAGDRLIDALSNWDRERQLEQNSDISNLVSRLTSAYEDARLQIYAVGKINVPTRWENCIGGLTALLKEINDLLIMPWQEEFAKGKASYEPLRKQWGQTNPLEPTQAKLADWDRDLQSAWEESAEEIVCDCLPQRIPQDKPAVFVASSSEGRRVAEALIGAIEAERDSWDVRPWFEPNFFGSGTATLEALEDGIANCHFGIYVMTRDDGLEIRGQSQIVPRGNVVFEYGIGVGMHGRLRSIIVHSDIEKITDLNGITTKPYKAPPSGRPGLVSRLLGKGKRVSHSPPEAAELKKLAGEIIVDIEKEIQKSHDAWRR